MGNYFRNSSKYRQWHIARPPDSVSYWHTGRHIALCWVDQRGPDVAAETAGNSTTIRPKRDDICKVCLRMEAHERIVDERRREYLRMNAEWIMQWDEKNRIEFGKYLREFGPPDDVEKALLPRGNCQ